MCRLKGALFFSSRSFHGSYVQKRKIEGSILLAGKFLFHKPCFFSYNSEIVIDSWVEMQKQQVGPINSIHCTAFTVYFKEMFVEIMCFCQIIKKALILVAGIKTEN